MQKKILAIVMSVVMLVGICSISGCGNKSNVSNAYVVPEGGFDINAPVEITFAHTMNQELQKVLDLAIADFNKIYPNITVKHSQYGGWKEINGQINTEITGDTQPNIAYCYPDHVAMYNLAKAVIILDNLIDSDMQVAGTNEILGLTEEQKNDFIEAYYNEGKVYGDGSMYTMPLNKSTEALFYNKDFFDKHGLKVPTTWDEMWEVCAQIKAIDPTCYPLGYDAEDNWFITLCEQMKSGYTSSENGGQYLFDNDQNKAMMKVLRENYQKGYFTTQDIYGQYTSKLFTETTDVKSYMCIGSTGGTKNQRSNSDMPDGTYAFDVGVAPIPQLDQNNAKVISQGPNLCILKGNKTTDQQVMASWLFVKFLCTDPVFQGSMSMLQGYMPVIKSVVDNPTYSEWLSKADGKANLVASAVQMGMDAAEIEGYYFVSPAFRGSSAARSEVGELLIKCITEPSQNVDSDLNKWFANAVDNCK